MTTRPGFVEPVLVPSGKLAAFESGDKYLIGQLFGDRTGPAVVLLHASGSDMRSWFPLAEKLAARGLTVLAFDFRGYGQSEGDKDPSAYATDAAAALDFLFVRGNSPFALVGAEGGGTAAVIAAATGVPAKIEAIALVGSGAKFGPLDATEAAGKLKLRTLVYSSGDDGGDQLAGLIDNSELRRGSAPRDPANDVGLQDELVAFVKARLG